MTALPIKAAHDLALVSEEHRWLIEELWNDEAVGIVGGEPKCCKSFLALDMAVSVASGTSCLGRFPVVQTGRVLLFPAEDALHVVRQRIEGICQSRGVAITTCDIQVITAPTVRIDLETDRERLEQTIEQLRPKLLVLDPFVRIHRVDENSCAEVAPLLAFLRELQRRHHVAVVVVHHAKKGSAHIRAGQALRGSSEFHGWSDCALYLRRSGEQLTLATEHRAAPSQTGIDLALVAVGDALALKVMDAATPAITSISPSVADKVEQALARGPLGFAELRQACHVRATSLYQILPSLIQQGRIQKIKADYQLVS